MFLKEPRAPTIMTSAFAPFYLRTTRHRNCWHSGGVPTFKPAAHLTCDRRNNLPHGSHHTAAHQTAFPAFAKTRP
jgi:hypothetical protein